MYGCVCANGNRLRDQHADREKNRTPLECLRENDRFRNINLSTPPLNGNCDWVVNFRTGECFEKEKKVEGFGWNCSMCDVG